MVNEHGFGVAIVVNGQELPETEHDGAIYVAAVPGARYSIRTLLPMGARYGVIIKVDGELAYGKRPPAVMVAATRNSDPLPNGMDKKRPEDLAENDLPFFYSDYRNGGFFTFAQAEASDDANPYSGVIELYFFDDASKVGGSRGGDMKTVAEPHGEGGVNIDYSLNDYRQGNLIHQCCIRYASQAYLRAHGILQ